MSLLQFLRLFNLYHWLAAGACGLVACERALCLAKRVNPFPNREPVHRLMAGDNHAIILLKQAPSLKDARVVSRHSPRSKERNLQKLTAVLDNTRPAMSKTSLDFRFFCDVNQNLKAAFAVNHLSGPVKKQKFTSQVSQKIDSTNVQSFFYFSPKCLYSVRLY